METVDDGGGGGDTFSLPPGLTERTLAYHAETLEEYLKRLRGLEQFFKVSEARLFWPKTVTLASHPHDHEDGAMSPEDFDERSIEGLVYRIANRLRGVQRLSVRDMVVGRRLQAEMVRMCNLPYLRVIELLDCIPSDKMNSKFSVPFDTRYPVDQSSICVGQISIGGDEAIPTSTSYNWHIALITAVSVKKLDVLDRDHLVALIQAINQQPQSHINLTNLVSLVVPEPSQDELALFLGFAEMCTCVETLVLLDKSCVDDNSPIHDPTLWETCVSRAIFPSLKTFHGRSEMARIVVRASL